VANGVDLAAFMQADIPTTGPLRVICVARLIERKGQQHLIEAVRRLVAEGVDIALELVGTGDARPALDAQVSAAGVAKNVRFLGYVPRDAIAERYAAAHVFVLASYNEGMSVATLEALAAGLPVVVTRTGGTAELVDDGSNGFTFDWADVDALVNHLRALASDRDLARRMGAAARQRAAQFSWAAAAGRYLEMFEQISVAPTYISQEQEAGL
jgi:glycosyltransferase involved in cell wall biosynthesis